MAANRSDLMLGLGLDASGAIKEAQRLADLMRRELGGAGAGGAKSADEIADALKRAAEAADTAKRAMGGAMDEARRAQEAARSADALADALRRSGAAAAETKREMGGLEKSSEQAAQAMSRANPAKSLAAARDVLDIRSFTAIQREIDQVNAAYKRLSDSGKLSSAELQHAAAAQQAAIARLNAEMGKLGHAGQQSAAQTAQAFRQLPMQLQDVFVSLAGGMNPLMVLTQQGPQITSSFGGVKETFKAITGAISPMAAGLMGGLAAVATLGVAYNQGSAEADGYAKALILTGNAAGSTVGQLQQVAVRVSDVVGTQAAAAEAVAALAGTGRIAAADLERLTLVTVQWERATGQAASEVAKQFAELGKAPLEASLKLNESMRYLTAATYNQIKALDEEGRSNEAARVAQEAYAAAMEQRAGQITARLGAIESAWKGVKDGAASAWDAMLGIGRKQTIEGMLAESGEKIARMEANAGKSARLGAGAGAIEAEKRRQRDLQIEASDAAKRAGNRAAEAKQLEAKAKWDKDAQQYLSKEEQKTKAIAKMRGEAAAAGASEAEIRTRIAGIEDKFKDPAKKPKSNIGAFNRGESADVALAKAQAQAALTAEIDATNAIRKELERRHSLGMAASGDYYQQLADLAAREAKAKLAAIDAEATAEKARATKDPASAKQSEARLIEIATKRAQEVAAAREKAADIGAQAEREALDESRRIAQEWAQSWQTADKMAQQYASASAKAQAAMIVDPLERARAEARIAAQQIANDGAQMMLDLGAQIDMLSGAGLSAQADALRVKLDQIREGIKAEQARTIAAPDVAMVADYLGKESPGQKIAEGFDAASQSLSAFVTGFQSLLKVETDYGKAMSARGLTSQQIAEIQSVHMAQQVNAYGTLAGAAKGFFRVGSTGYKGMQKAEQVFRATEMALSIKAAALKMGLITEETSARLSGYADSALSAVDAAGTQIMALFGVGQASAAVGVAQQAQGDPYTAIPRMVGMAAVMAGLGFAVGGIGGGGGSGAPSAADRQASNGTGTVLGDDSAKSESIAKSIDALTSVDTLTMQYSAQMLASLRGIEAAMAGVSTQILRAGGVTTGKNLGINTGSSGAGDAVGALLSKIPLIGGIMGGVVGGIISGIFGKSSTAITDAGLSISGTAAQMQQGQGVNQYADATTTKKSWFGSSTRTGTVMQDAGDDVARQFGLIFSGVGDSLQSAAGAMGQDAAAVAQRLAGYVIDIPRLSLQGLKGDDLQEAISTAVGAKADEMARLVAPGLVDFQRIGEGYYETVIRVASSTEQAAGVLRSLGVAQIDAARLQRKQADDMVAELVRESITLVERGAGGMATAIGQIVDTMSGSAAEIADAYRKLRDTRGTMQMMGMSGDGLTRSTISGAGGLDALQSAMSSFEDQFFTDAEKAAFATKRMQAEFIRLGVAMPATMDGFRSLITGMDTSGEAGQMLQGQLLLLSGGFADLMASTEEAATAVESLTAKQREQVAASLAQLGIGRGANADTAVNSAGGMDALQSGMSAFEAKFFGDSERFAVQSARLADQFKALGVAMPTSAGEFRGLVSGVDATSEAGSKLLGGLLPLSGGFADLMDRMGQLKTATGSLGKGVEDEVARIRGVIGQRDGQSVAGAQTAFAVATAQARAGDAKALDALPGLSQAMLKAAEEQSTTRADVVRLQAQTAASLQATLDAVRGAPDASAISAPVAGVPGMIASPAQASTAPAAPTAPPAPSSGNSALLIELQSLRTESAAMRSELQAMRQSVESGLTTVATNTGRSARILDRVTAGGDTVQTEVVTA